MKKILVRLIAFHIILTFSVSAQIQQTGTLTDIDGNIYKTVVIGNQEWMAENLKVTHYRNGEAIPNVADSLEWLNNRSGAYCYYNNDAGIASIYGNLYNYFAQADTRLISPEGWHVPTEEEWVELEIALGMSQAEAGLIEWRGTNEGNMLKEAGIEHWLTSNSEATNESGFTALPGGYRQAFEGFKGLNFRTYFWSSSRHGSSDAWRRYLSFNQPNINRKYEPRGCGFSIRLVKDQTPTSIKDETNEFAPKEYELYQNFPNPFNPETTIRFSVPTPSHVELSIYSSTGQKIQTLLSETIAQGMHFATWDGTSTSGKQIASGIYIYRLSVENYTLTQKMLLIK